jgi:alpha-L-fucosidase
MLARHQTRLYNEMQYRYQYDGRLHELQVWRYMCAREQGKIQGIFVKGAKICKFPAKIAKTRKITAD